MGYPSSACARGGGKAVAREAFGAPRPRGGSMGSQRRDDTRGGAEESDACWTLSGEDDGGWSGHASLSGSSDFERTRIR